MELRTLRSFLAVAREGNVTRAARTLHITQPALSRHLAEYRSLELGDLLLLLRAAQGERRLQYTSVHPGPPHGWLCLVTSAVAEGPDNN